MSTTRYDVPASVVNSITEHTQGSPGTILTVATVTATKFTAQRLERTYDNVVAEAMEGAGVAAAAALHGVACAEIRAISNPVGPRDRAAWQIDDALNTLTEAAEAMRGRWTA